MSVMVTCLVGMSLVLLQYLIRLAMSMLLS